MKSVVKDIFVFAAGAAVGYFLTKKFLEEKYEQRYQEDVKSTKEAYSRRGLDAEPEEANDEVEDELPDIKAYAALLKEEQYVDYSEVATQEKKEEKVDRPYVISPKEFGELDNYERISLTYYADQQLADEEDELVDDVDEIVGEDSLTHFGEFEPDSVFVRNDARKCDYEILLDQRNYFDVIKSKPHRPSMED